MKLREIMRHRREVHRTTVGVEPAGGVYGVFDVEVEFDYEPASVSQHIRGDPSSRERHPPSITIDSVVLAEEVTHSETDKSWPKGTDVHKLPGWSKDDDEYVLQQLYEEIDPSDQYDDDDDGYDDTRDWG